MVFEARAAGISGSIASIMPQRMPRARLPRSDWLGSSTSPPLITRSNLSAGPIAALADVVKRPDSAAAAADPVSSRKCRRDKADRGARPLIIFLCMDDAPGAGFPQAADHRRGRICAEIEMLDFDRRSARGALNVNRPLDRKNTSELQQPC